jgi:O-antigen/teichoic acid export membrane protein
MNLLHALKWSFLAAIAVRIIQPITYILLARLLTTSDFGIMTAALILITLSQIFWEAGMGKALIQWQNDIEQAANAAFWVNMFLGFFIACVLYFSAAEAAKIFFKDVRVGEVIKVMTMQIILGALGSVFTALLQKEMKFKKLFLVRLITIFVSSLVTIIAAIEGYGYWALVIGALTGQSSQLICLWFLVPWRPRFDFDIGVAFSMTRFGSWVALSGLLAWYYLWIDSLFIARYFDLGVVGEYRVSNELIAALLAFVFGPIISVLYPYLSKNAKNLYHESKKLLWISYLSVWLSVPLGCFLFFFSEDIVLQFLGDKWSGAAIILACMAIVQAVGYFSAFNGEIYRAFGRPELETRIWLIGVFIYTPAYYYYAQISIDAFLQGRIILVLAFLPLHNFILCRLLVESQLKILINQILLSAIIIIIGGFVASTVGWLGIVGITQMLVFLVLYGFFLIGAVLVVERRRLLTFAVPLLLSRNSAVK